MAMTTRRCGPGRNAFFSFGNLKAWTGPYVKAMRLNSKRASRNSAQREFLARGAIRSSYSGTAFCLMYASNDRSGPM